MAQQSRIRVGGSRRRLHGPPPKMRNVVGLSAGMMLRMGVLLPDRLFDRMMLSMMK